MIKPCLLIFCCILSSCQYIVPQYKVPKPQVVPQNWGQKNESMQLSQSNVSELAWWERFHDQTLNHYIEEALHYNNQLGVARGILKESEASLQKVKWSWLPSVNASGVMYRGELLNVSNNRRFGELLNRSWEKTSWPYSGYLGGVTPSYTLNLFAKYNETKKLQWDHEAKYQMFRAVRLAVISQTTMSYFNVLGFKKQLQILEQTIQDMEEQRKYTAIQYQKGAISKIELLNIEERIEYLKREVPKVKQSIKISENALALLTNRQINTIQTQDVFEKINQKQIVLYNVPSSTLKQRPDVLAAENELKKYNAQVAQAISALLPTVNITALLDNFGFYLGNFVSFTTNIIQGELSAVMPLVDGSIYGDIKKAKAVEYAAIYHYLGALTLAIADIDTAMASRNNSLIGLGHIQRAQEKTKAQLQLGRIQYETGAISYLEYLNYKVNHETSKLKLVQYQQLELNSTVRLYQALAGGSCIENASKRSSSKLKE